MPAKSGADSSTVDRIKSAAIELFFEKGYNATSLREIADSVGVQVGSLYNHISSKEELLYGIMRGIMEDLIEETRTRMGAAGPDPGADVLAFMRCSIRFHGARKRETFIGNTELRGLSTRRRRAIIRLRDEYEALLRDALQRASDAGVLDVPDVPLATFAGLALCTNVAVWYQEGGRLSLEEVEELLPGFFAPLADFRLAAEGAGN